MGITEETGQTARSVVTSLGANPLILAVLIFNVLYVGVTTFLFLERNKSVTESEVRWNAMVQSILQLCQPGRTP